MDAQTLAITIIERLGGTAATAELCEVTPGAVSQWKKETGIPKSQLKFLRAIRPDVFDDRRKNSIASGKKRRPTDNKS
ncbi:carph-isopro domain-containing protein [Herbaspirillum sp. ST 5-3]|uniref:carph-isopro domain-containing protein n=1 Tax=Noviherbaspirillum sp. ST 5-3 TaxID=3349878 RepID=UPI0010A46E0E